MATRVVHGYSRGGPLFVHREDLTGAKAGATSHVLAQHSDPHAELIAVVDANYHVEPDWLKAVVGHFEGRGVGFVQTPHAYRNWQNSLYQCMCAWEYAFFFQTTMRSLNEHAARDGGNDVRHPS